MQHIILLVLRQYENKSYRMFVEWLFKEAYYLRMFMQLSNIPHYTTLQKFAARVSGTIYIGEDKDNFFIRSIIT